MSHSPFHFWCNDDHDEDNAEVVPPNRPDNADQVIIGRRDLEDFTRLFLHLGAFHQELANGTMKVGLKCAKR